MAKKLITCMLSLSMAATALVTPLGEHVGKLFKIPTFSANAIQIEDNFNLDDSSETIIKFQTDISKSNPIVTLSATNFSYTGKAITPFVSFRRSSTAVRELKVGTEITVSYKNNVNPGTATVIITGINKYKGTVTKTFTISDQTTSEDEEVIKTGSAEVIWEGSEDLGSWDKDVDLGITNIPIAEEGGILTVKYTASGATLISIINKIGDAWTWTPLKNASGEEFFDTTGGKLQIRLTSEQAQQLVSSKAMFIKGQDAVVTEITYTAPGSDDPDDSSEADDSSEPDCSSTDYDDSSYIDIPEWDENDFDNTIGTRITIKNPVTDAWGNCFPKYKLDDGTLTDDYIDAKTFTKDTPMNVTVNFEWTKYATEQGYIQFRPAFANGWDSIFKYGYITNVNIIDKNCKYIQDGVGLKTNSGKIIRYAIQPDGFFFSNVPECNQVRFTITADGVNKMIAAATASYTSWEGIIFHNNGLKINSIELSQSGVRTASGLSYSLISGNYKYRILNEKEVEIIKYNGSEVNLTIPSTIEGKKVTKIGSNAFEGCKRLTSLIIPESVTSIGENAFRNCHSLTKIIIPKNVTSIGDYAFYNCDSLLNVTIPDGIIKIGNGVFEWCTNLTNVIIPNTVTYIGNSSFAYCNSLTSIKLPHSIKNIDDGAFESCTNLKNITIPNKTEIIGIKVFSDCYNLESVLIPNSVTTIMTNAFASCINLKNVYYTGSKTKWSNIIIASNNDYLKKAIIHYNYDPNHKHLYKSTIVKPTYSAQGYTLHKCSTCGNSYKDNYKAKLTLSNITKTNFTSSANAVKMSWNKVSGATGYRVYKYNTSTKKWQTVANTKNTSYTFSKLKSGTTYKFTVRAYRTEGGKTYLSPKYSTFTTSTNPATVNFKLSAGSKKATVKWSKVTGATGYKVYYKTSKNGSWKCLKTTNNKTTSYTKTGLTKGKTYYFTVKAYRTVGGKTYNGSYTTKNVKIK